MEVLATRINIANLRNLLNAAEALQEAGEQDRAIDALRTLARNIDAQLPHGRSDAPIPPPPEPPMRKGA